MVARSLDEATSNLAHLEYHLIKDGGKLRLFNGTMRTSLGPIRGCWVSYGLKP